MEELEISDKWILSKLNSTIAEVTENLDKYELGVAVSKVYDFIWDSYCDWYIELTKARLYSENEKSKLAAQKVLLYVLDQFLRLLHPFMPFLTEEIWQAIPHDGEALIISKWPEYREELNFKAEEDAMESIMNAIRSIRNRRAEMNVPPSKKCSLYITTSKQDVFESGIPFFLRLAYADQVEVLAADPADHEKMASCITADAKLYMPMSQLVDTEKELARIAKEKAKVEQDIARTEGKLQNEKFISKAPEAVVNQEREKLARIKALFAQLCEAEESLSKL